MNGHPTNDRLLEATKALVRELDPRRDEHPPLESVLTQYAEGKLSVAERRDVESHLEICAICREDVADMRSMAAVLEKPRRWNAMLLTAAAAAVVVMATTLLLRRETETPRPVAPPITTTRSAPIERPAGYARTEWDTLVRNARGGELPSMPIVLQSIREAPEIIRGSSGQESQIRPAGVALRTARPEFRWPERKDATSTVILFRGEEEVMRSGALKTSRWVPPRDLPRGVTYSWQVDIEQDERLEILPHPPAPAAKFFILEFETLAEIESAERLHPHDDLLLGLLTARAGLDAEARAHLRRVREPIAQRMLRELDSWSAP